MANLTDAQVKSHYMNERFELYQATLEQVLKLCEEVGTDQPLMHWEMCTEEMHALMQDCIIECG